jgi:uncharacterized membrane protein YgcG
MNVQPLNSNEKSPATTPPPRIHGLNCPHRVWAFSTITPITGALTASATRATIIIVDIDANCWAVRLCVNTMHVRMYTEKSAYAMSRPTPLALNYHRLQLLSRASSGSAAGSPPSPSSGVAPSEGASGGSSFSTALLILRPSKVGAFCSQISLLFVKKIEYI